MRKQTNNQQNKQWLKYIQYSKSNIKFHNKIMKTENKVHQNKLLTDKINNESNRKKIESMGSRKSFSINNQRLKELQLIKNRKRNTFLKQIQNRNLVIEKKNAKMLEKLTISEKKISEFNNIPKLKEFRDITPFRKKQLATTQKQNIRIRDKLKSLASAINTKKIIEDYQKSQIIKNRISRRHDSNSSLSLDKSVRSSNNKSQKLVYGFKNSIKSNILNENENNITQKYKTSIKKLKINEKKLETEYLSREYGMMEQKKHISFYKKDEILKNRLDLKDQIQLQRRKKLSFIYKQSIRPLTEQILTEQTLTKKFDKKIQGNNSNTFFPTQVTRSTTKSFDFNNVKKKI